MSRGGRKQKAKLRKALDLYLKWVKYTKGTPGHPDHPTGCPHTDIGFGTSPTGLPTISCSDCGEYATGGGVVLARKRAAGEPTPPPGHAEELGGIVPLGKPGTGKTTGSATMSPQEELDKFVPGTTQIIGPPPTVTSGTLFGNPIDLSKLTPMEESLLNELMKKVGPGTFYTPTEAEFGFLHMVAEKMSKKKTAEEELPGIFNKGPVAGEGPPPPLGLKEKFLASHQWLDEDSL